jgi:hypothetical protein
MLLKIPGNQQPIRHSAFVIRHSSFHVVQLSHYTPPLFPEVILHAVLFRDQGWALAKEKKGHRFPVALGFKD